MEYFYKRLRVFILPVIELPWCNSILISSCQLPRNTERTKNILNQCRFVQTTLNNICQASLDSQSKAISESLASIQEAFIAVTGMEVIEKKALLIFSQFYFSGV